MDRVLSGMRPTGPLHLGHWLGALENWVRLQETHECFFMVADLHALMGEYENPADIRKNSVEMIVDWIACGINPSNIFIQSEISEHAELALMLGMLTPLGWLERNPTYKEQLREIQGRDLTTYGFLGYPVLQAADILLYKANKVPVGEDQLAHLELTREIIRRFRHLYKSSLFPEPEALLTKASKILGTDRRKMSKSYGNAINLSDSEQAIKKKIQSMITDPARIKASDPGHPDICNVFSYYSMFSRDLVHDVRDWCTNAKKGCTDCKKNFSDVMVDFLRPVQKKREEIRDSMKDGTRYNVALKMLVGAGQQRAEKVAKGTMSEVKKILNMNQWIHEN